MFLFRRIKFSVDFGSFFSFLNFSRNQLIVFCGYNLFRLVQPFHTFFVWCVPIHSSSSGSPNFHRFAIHLSPSIRFHPPHSSDRKGQTINRYIKQFFLNLRTYVRSFVGNKNFFLLIIVRRRTNVCS